MNKTSLAILIIVIVALLVGAGFWLMAGRNSNTNNTNLTTNNDNRSLTNQSNLNANRTVTNSNLNTNTSVNANSNTNSSANTNSAAPGSVSITSAGFSPRTLTVQAGTTVTWTNNDTATHYVVPDDHPSHFKYAGVWDDDGTGQISRGQTYSNPFLLEGTYTYHDHLNPSTSGTIIVK